MPDEVTLLGSPGDTHQKISNLFRLQDGYISRLVDLTRSAVLTGNADIVTLNVTASKIRELFGKLKQEIDTLETIISHP